MVTLLVSLFLVLLATSFFAKKADYIVGNRDTSTLHGGISIAATWIWAPALFVSTQQAYVNGYVGFLSFLIPNVLTLIIFAFFAQRLRNNYPNGFNLPDIIGKSRRIRWLYRFNFSGLSILSIAVQLLAGSQILSIATGWSFLLCALLLWGMALSYTVWRGINASILTDVIQYAVMVAAGFFFLFHIDTAALAFNGINNNIHSFFSGDGLSVFLAFGIPTALALISGPFGDGSFYQRVWAIKKEKVFRAFLLSAGLFGVVPLLLGLVGFAAAGAGFIPTNVGQVGVEYMKAVAPAYAIYIIFAMLLAGLLSTIDSHLSFLASLGKTRRMQVALTLLLPIISVLIAIIPGNSVTMMFLFYGIFRASSLVTNMRFILNPKLREPSIFWSVLLTELIGFVPFAIGNLMNLTWLKIAGVLLTIVLPLLVIRYHQNRKNYVEVAEATN